MEIGTQDNLREEILTERKCCRLGGLDRNSLIFLFNYSTSTKLNSMIIIQWINLNLFILDAIITVYQNVLYGFTLLGENEFRLRITLVDKKRVGLRAFFCLVSITLPDRNDVGRWELIWLSRIELVGENYISKEVSLCWLAEITLVSVKCDGCRRLNCVG